LNQANKPKEEEMKKVLAVVVCAVVCLFATSVFAQEEPVAEESATEGYVVAEQPSAREILEQGLTVEKGATANVNLNENVINVPEQPAPVVNNSIEFPDEMGIARTDRTWCERHPMACTFIIVGVVGVVGGGAAYGAKCAGWFDTKDTVSFE